MTKGQRTIVALGVSAVVVVLLTLLLTWLVPYGKLPPRTYLPLFSAERLMAVFRPWFWFGVSVLVVSLGWAVFSWKRRAWRR